MDIDDFLNKNGKESWNINTFNYVTNNELNEHIEKIGKPQYKPNKKVWTYKELDNKLKNYDHNSTHGFHNGLKSNIKYRSWGYNENGDENGEVRYILKIAEKTEIKSLPFHTNDYIKKTPYSVVGNKVKYSILKEEYKQQNNTHGYKNEDGDNFIEDDNTFPEKYYWKTPDGWLYLYDKDKPEIISLDIGAPLPVKNVIQPNISTEPLIILLFANSCCKKTDIKNLRFGIKDIYNIYKTWCKINNKKILKTQKKFKEEFKKINYKEENSKGIDVNNKPGKRGYNIMVSL